MATSCYKRPPRKYKFWVVAYQRFDFNVFFYFNWNVVSSWFNGKYQGWVLCVLQLEERTIWDWGEIKTYHIICPFCYRKLENTFPTFNFYWKTKEDNARKWLQSVAKISTCVMARMLSIRVQNILNQQYQHQKKTLHNTLMWAALSGLLQRQQISQSDCVISSDCGKKQYLKNNLKLP